MKWIVVCCTALIVGCSSPASRTTPTTLPTPTEAQKLLEAGMYDQAQAKCASTGMVALATQTANATTYACVSPDDPAYKAQQAAKQPEKPAK